MRPVLLPSCLLSLTCGLPAAASPQTSIPLSEQLRGSAVAFVDRYGEAIAFDGERAVVGAGNSDDHGLDSGSVYVFDMVAGREIAHIAPADGETLDHFGSAVDVDGNTIVVGAHGDDDQGAFSGSAYLFDVTTGTQLHKLLPEDGTREDHFGASVAVDGTRALVGSPRLAQATGSAYLFDVRTGRQIAQLAPEGSFTGKFGPRVALCGDLAVVGGSEAVSAYVFDARTGREIARCMPSTPGSPDLLASVAIEGDLLLVGRRLEEVDGVVSGAARLFDARTGLELAAFAPSDGTYPDLFGGSVALHGSLVVIGAPGDSDLDRSGSIYLFDLTTGREITKLVPSDLLTNGRTGFATAVAVQGSTVLVGAPLDDSTGLVTGTVYRFDQAPSVGFRNAGTNPDSYRSSTAWRGSPATFTVDLTTTGHSHAAVFGFDAPFEHVLSGGQALLCLDLSGVREIFVTNFHPGPLASIECPVPDLPTVAGFPVFTQAVHAFGVQPFALSNAQDVVLGGCTGRETWSRKLVGEPGVSEGQLGSSIALDGTRAVLGAPRSTSDDTPAGAALMFDTSSGRRLAELVADDRSAEDWFGWSVAIDDDRAVVGAPREDTNGPRSGAAYVFAASTGTQLVQLLPLDGWAYGAFGSAVDVEGSRALVGAAGTSDFGNSSGSAYLFDVATGAQLVKLLPDDGAQGDLFGYSVALGGGVALVGATQGLLAGTGVVYVFEAESATLLGTLEALDGASYDRFGSSVATDGVRVIVGAPDDDDRGDASGSAYLYDLASGRQIAKLLAEDGARGDRFGVSVAIHGTTAVVGTEENGCAYRFDAATGEPIDVLLLSCDAAGGFGRTVATRAGTVLVGAPLDDVNGDRSGSAYVFEAPGIRPQRDRDRSTTRPRER